MQVSAVTPPSAETTYDFGVVQGWAVLSKCANPECTETFRYLRQGKIFFLTPGPNLLALPGESSQPLYERFWLCEGCSKENTLAWDGKHAKITALQARPVILLSPIDEEATTDERSRSRAAAAGPEV